MYNIDCGSKWRKVAPASNTALRQAVFAVSDVHSLLPLALST
jgi:hypothetical protein